MKLNFFVNRNRKPVLEENLETETLFGTYVFILRNRNPYKKVENTFGSVRFFQIS